MTGVQTCALPIYIESDKTTMAIVRRALHDPTITSIREVGMKGGFALVMIASGECGAPTPDYDRWTIYNVALRIGSGRVLVSGYGVKLLDWIGSTKIGTCDYLLRLLGM